MQVALEERRELDNEFRMIRPDGAVRWMRSQGRALYDLDGKPLRMVGVTFDITKNKLAEEELRRREEELRIITNGVPALISYVDREQPPEPLPIEGDVTRLVQVVSNLLHNAAKYTETGGDIRVTAEGRGSEVQIRVKDNGVGIPAAVLPHVFDLFTQSEHTLGRSEGGLGIGLTLVKNIVEMHGGTVRALSAGLGQGTEVVISLPAGTSPSHPALAETGNLAVAGDAFSNRRRILVVDDNVDAAESLALLLGLGGMRCGRYTTDPMRSRPPRPFSRTSCCWTSGSPR